MCDETQTPFAIEELAILFRALHETESECVLIGGQAVNLWATRYAATEPSLREIQNLFPFVSKDADFQGDSADAIALSHALGSMAQIPTFRRAFGNLMAGQFTVKLGAHPLKIEVLRKVPGLTDAELLRLTTQERSVDYTVRVLNPVGVLLAKTWNVANITKGGRHDAEQLLITIPSVRAYIREFLVAGQTDARVLRAALNLIKVTLAFAETKSAAVATARCGIDWSQLLPHAHIAASAQPELVRLRDKRIPGWLARVGSYSRPALAEAALRRLLEILTQHAEPLCARPAARRASRLTHSALRRL